MMQPHPRRFFSFAILFAILSTVPAVRGDVTPELVDLPSIANAVRALSILPADPLLVKKMPEPRKVEGRPHLAIARSLRTVQAGRDSIAMVREGRAFVLLAQARNYRHLGLMGRALGWYRLAAKADRDSTHCIPIAQERLLCAVAIADSATAIGEAKAFLDAPVLGAGESIGRLLERAAVRSSDTEQLELATRVRQTSEFCGSRALLFAADFFARQDRIDDALELYLAALAQENSAGDVIARSLKGLADTAFVSGREREAAALYRLYRSRDLGLLSAWSTYRLGSIAAADARMDVAHDLFRSICERELYTPWKEEACDLMRNAAELREIEAILRRDRRDLRLGRD